MKGVCRVALYRIPTATKRMRITKDEQCKPVPKRPTPLQAISGILALSLVCFSVLCFYFHKTPAYASSGYHQINGTTTTGQVPFDDTETVTPSQTVTTTPSSTVTTTSTPIPSPSATRTSTPLPTSTWTETSNTRPTTAATDNAATNNTVTNNAATDKQTQKPVQMSLSNDGQGSGGNQASIATTAPTNNQGKQSNQSGNQSGHTFPFLSLGIFLGGVVLLGLLVKAWWMILRGRGLPSRSRKWSPSGAAAWSRTRITDRHNAIVAQRTFDLATAVYPLSNNDSYGGIDQTVDLSSLVAGERLSRNAPHTTDSLPAFQEL
jgi:hypothetical protein